MRPAIGRIYDRSMRRLTSITADAAAVRAEHLAAYRRLMFALKRHRSALNDDGRRLFNHVAFSLYVDAQTIDEITPVSAVLDDVISPRTTDSQQCKMSGP